MKIKVITVVVLALGLIAGLVVFAGGYSPEIIIPNDYNTNVDNKIKEEIVSYIDSLFFGKGAVGEFFCV